MIYIVGVCRHRISIQVITMERILVAGNESLVGRMFNGRSVFVTGASGFIGRVLVAKLLGSYPGIRRIYILMRPKKNMSPQERLNKQLFQLPIFEQIKLLPNGNQLLAKIHVIDGDLNEPWLGMSSDHLDLLTTDQTLSFVFHSAATVKFDEPLKVAIRLNLIATRTIIELCRRIPNLISFCHVSTAYVNSDLQDGQLIEERLYPMSSQPEDLMQLVDLMDQETMQLLKKSLVGKHPNTYTYTKALAEHMIAAETGDLPVAIVRPSIVVAAWREPLPGWIDNFNGPTGLVLAIGKGILRSLHVKTECKAELIPVDITVNTIIASAYYAAKQNNKLSFISQSTTLSDIPDTLVTEDSKVKQKPFVVHCNSGELNPITWAQIEQQVFPIIRNNPSRQVLRYPFGTFKNNRYYDLAWRPFSHIIPAIILDLLLWLSGHKRFVLSVYAKLHATTRALEHFTTHDYNYKSENIHLIRRELCDEDRKILKTDIENMQWVDFWKGYILGTRRYILKESDDTLPEARQNLQRYLWIERGLRTVLCLLAALFCFRIVIPTVSPIVNNMIR